MRFEATAALLCLCVGLQNLAAQPASNISATPQRPSNSTSSATAPFGWLEMEAGSTISDNGFNTPVVFKLGINRNSELFVGLTPLLRVSEPDSETGLGDTVVGGRWRFFQQEAGASLAAQVSVKLPTASSQKGLGSGEPDYNFLMIWSQGWENMALDINAGFSAAGLPAGGSDEQVLGIVTLSRGFSPRLSGYGELLVLNSFEFREAMLLGSAGAAYSLSARAVLDAAVNFNLADAPFDFQVLAGMTVVLAQVW